MTTARGAALVTAQDRADLPRTLAVDGLRVGTLRLGVFAPQYDSAFTTADVLLLDLRGNFGGFQREARLFAAALAPVSLSATFDVFATGRTGTLRLEPLPDDPSCGQVTPARPLVVLTDAGSRSAGEHLAAWLWGAGAVVAGERTIGAGGGLDSEAQGFELPRLGFRVRTSGTFTVFDVTRALRAGETAEAPLLDPVARDGFAPSRTRPVAIQAVGVRPDLVAPTTLADLRDGGASWATGIVRRLGTQGELP